MDLFWYQFLFVFYAEALTDSGNGDTNTGVSNGTTDCGIDDVNTGFNNSMCTVIYVYWVLFRNESVLILIYVVFSTEASTDGGNDDVNNGVSNGTCILLYILC